MFLLIALLSLFPNSAMAAEPNSCQSLAAYESVGLCGGEGARCVTNLDCCRGSCQLMTCRSGPIYDPCKRNGSVCSSSFECCSKSCLGSRCQPRIEP